MSSGYMDEFQAIPRHNRKKEMILFYDESCSACRNLHLKQSAQDSRMRKLLGLLTRWFLRLGAVVLIFVGVPAFLYGNVPEMAIICAIGGVFELAMSCYV